MDGRRSFFSNHNLSISSNNSNNSSNKGTTNNHGVGRGVGGGWRRPPSEFANIDLVQEIDEGQGPIRAASFSRCGQLLATGGADALVRLYVSQKAWRHFAGLRSSRIVSEEAMQSCNDTSLDAYPFTSDYASLLLFAVFEGHADEVIDLSWSAHNFLLSVSVDRTVRLWHVSQVDCLLVLRHEDYLSTARFMPTDDRYLVSCTLGGVVRLWSVPEKAVRFTRNVALERDNRPSIVSKNVLTAACFTSGGSILVLGTADGRLLFYFTDRLQYITQQHVCPTSAPRVIAIESVSTEDHHGQNNGSFRQLLVTTDDSRVRLFTSHYWTLSKEVLELKGATLKNAGVAIRASISPDGAFVVCGSEEPNCFYVWQCRSRSSNQKTLGANLWERFHRRGGCERICLNLAKISVEQLDGSFLSTGSSRSSGSPPNSLNSSINSNQAAVAASIEGLLNIDLFADFNDTLETGEVAVAEEAFEHLEMICKEGAGKAGSDASSILEPISEHSPTSNSSSFDTSSFSNFSTLSSNSTNPTTFAFFAPDPRVFHSLVKYVLLSIDHTGRIRVFTKPHYAA